MRRPGRRPLPAAKRKRRANIRLDPEIFAALERESASKGGTLTAEIEGRLRNSFYSRPEPRKRAFQRPPDRALAYLAATLSRFISENAAGRDRRLSERYTWRRDRFCFEALRIGLDLLLSKLAPGNDLQVPPGSLEIAQQIAVASNNPEAATHLQTPQAVGIACAMGVWDQLSRTPEPPIARPSNIHYAAHFFEMPYVRRDLEVPEPKEEDYDTLEDHRFADGSSKIVNRPSKKGVS